MANHADKEVNEWAAYVDSVRQDAYEQGRADGYAEGYQRGAEEAREIAIQGATQLANQIQAKVQGLVVQAIGTSSQAAQEPPEKQQAASIQWTGHESNPEQIFIALRHQPGMRPAEIVRWLQSNGANPNVNSIFTTIKRLRDSNRIARRGDGWIIAGEMESAA